MSFVTASCLGYGLAGVSGFQPSVLLAVLCAFLSGDIKRWPHPISLIDLRILWTGRKLKVASKRKWQGDQPFVWTLFRVTSLLFLTINLWKFWKSPSFRDQQQFPGLQLAGNWYFCESWDPHCTPVSSYCSLFAQIVPLAFLPVPTSLLCSKSHSDLLISLAVKKSHSADAPTFL